MFAKGAYSAVGGGYRNTAISTYVVQSVLHANTSSQVVHSFVAALIVRRSSSIAGGYLNAVVGRQGTVAGGSRNTVKGRKGVVIGLACFFLFLLFWCGHE